MQKIDSPNQQSKNAEQYWNAVQERDTSFNGVFVYAVVSTGIYCKPSCPSRRPQRENAVFFVSNQAAEAAGFRSCKRCRPQDGIRDANAKLVEKICQIINSSIDDNPSLEKLSAETGISPYHLQRTFKKIVGITPFQYAKSHRVNQFKEGVKVGESVTNAMYDAGYGSSSRLYEKANDELGMTPAVYARGGEGMEIVYVTAPCRLGFLLVAATTHGLCSVQLGDTEQELQAKLFEEFPAAKIKKDDKITGEWVTEILRYLDGESIALNLPLDVQATAFQRRVWTELRRIPYGETRSYGDIASFIGQPSAVRAVARACATNPVALVTPCHRVVRGDGSLSGYRWGIERKKLLLLQEQNKMNIED